MDDKEILALLVWLEDEGYHEISKYVEDTRIGVCPCCKANSFGIPLKHEEHCRLNKAIKELKKRTD